MEIPRIGPAAVLRRDLAAVVGERALRTALNGGLLEQLWRGVVVDSSHALELRTRAGAAVLAVGEHAVLSGPTAVALHGYSAAESADVHVTVPYSRAARSRRGLVLHQNRFEADDVVEIGGLPLFASDFALAELLCDGDKRMAFASLDQALAVRTEQQGADLRAAIRSRLANRDDPRGTTRAGMLTEIATGKADSPPESSFRLIVIEAGFPVPDAQYEVHTIDGRRLYVLDMAWPQWRIALEYDGFAAHEDSKCYDADRDDRLAGRGWIIVRAEAADLRDPSRVLAELRAAFAQRS